MDRPCVPERYVKKNIRPYEIRVIFPSLTFTSDFCPFLKSFKQPRKIFRGFLDFGENYQFVVLRVRRTVGTFVAEALSLMLMTTW
jgi:hypothetical protein